MNGHTHNAETRTLVSQTSTLQVVLTVAVPHTDLRGEYIGIMLCTCMYMCRYTFMYYLDCHALLCVYGKYTRSV